MGVNILMFIYRFLMFLTFPAISRKFPQISRRANFKFPYVSICFYQESRTFSRISRKSRKFLRVIWVAGVVPKAGSVLCLSWNLQPPPQKFSNAVKLLGFVSCFSLFSLFEILINQSKICEYMNMNFCMVVVGWFMFKSSIFIWFLLIILVFDGC